MKLYMKSSTAKNRNFLTILEAEDNTDLDKQEGLLHFIRQNVKDRSVYKPILGVIDGGKEDSE